jgi:transposase
VNHFELYDLLENRAGLQRMLRAAETKESYQRIQCVWLRISFAMTSSQIAIAIGWSQSSVRNLHSAFRSHGEPSLSSQSRGGRRRTHFTIAQEIELLRPYERYTKAGLPLNVKALHSAYQRAAGVTVAKSTVYRLITRHGLSQHLKRRNSKPDRQQ